MKKIFMMLLLGTVLMIANTTFASADNGKKKCCKKSECCKNSKCCKDMKDCCSEGSSCCKDGACTMIVVAGIFSAKAGSDKKTISFKVYGNCGMCKKNIETALSIKGVKSAQWNVETKMVEIVFLPDVITEEKIHQVIAKAGYDTDLVKATDEDYKRLHTCYQYRK